MEIINGTQLLPKNTCPECGKQIQFTLISSEHIRLNKEEAQALYDVLKTEWINRHNPLAFQLVHEIGDWLSSFEVQKKSND